MFFSGAEDESLWDSSPCLVVSEGVRLHASAWWDQAVNSLCYVAVFLQHFKRLLSFPNPHQGEELRRFLCLLSAAHPRMHGVLCRRWENACSNSAKCVCLWVSVFLICICLDIWEWKCQEIVMLKFLAVLAFNIDMIGEMIWNGEVGSLHPSLTYM